jgi:hypothetical protein
MGGIYEYSVGIGSGAMIYTASFMKFVSGIQKLILGGDTHRDSKVIS